jgi:hypothetical protein
MSALKEMSKGNKITQPDKHGYLSLTRDGNVCLYTNDGMPLIYFLPIANFLANDWKIKEE